MTDSTTEVKRYDAVHIRYGDRNIRYGEGCEVEMVTALDYDALRAENAELKAELAALKANEDAYRMAVDTDLVCAHIGVTNPEDDYAIARKKLNDLICWSIQIDRDLNPAQPQSDAVLVPRELLERIDIYLDANYESRPLLQELRTLLGGEA